jgi:hypothetical protein
VPPTQRFHSVDPANAAEVVRWGTADRGFLPDNERVLLAALR